MKALTLTQPWASLVAMGAKRIETRSWSTTYRGPLAIHAAKNMPADAKHVLTRPPFARVLAPRFSSAGERGVVNWRWFPRGAIVATCELVDVVPILDHGTDVGSRARYVALDPEGAVRVWDASKFGNIPSHVGTAHPLTAEHEALFGWYASGRFAFLLSDVVKLATPIAARGALGIWDWDDDGALESTHSQPAGQED